jgi:hypothetical protein
MPTSEEILKVKQNIKNMIDFNNYLETQGNIKILNAYALLSLSDNKDLGLQIGLNLLCGAFWALGGPFGAVGAISANFLSGMVGSYAVTKPPSLQAQISSLLTRFQTTSEQLNSDLEILYGDPEAYWDNSYTGQVNTPFGTYTASCSVSELASIDFPAQTNQQFMDMIYTAQYALDQCVWAQLLQNFVITKFYPETDYPCKYYTEQDMEQDAAGFYSVHPSYWNNWTYVQYITRKGKDKSYYCQYQNNIGTGASMFSDGHLNDSACEYLFIDSYDNVIINPNGLFHRSFVFNNLEGIKHTTHTYTTSKL